MCPFKIACPKKFGLLTPWFAGEMDTNGASKLEYSVDA